MTISTTHDGAAVATRMIQVVTAIVAHAQQLAALFGEYEQIGPAVFRAAYESGGGITFQEKVVDSIGSPRLAFDVAILLNACGASAVVTNEAIPHALLGISRTEMTHLVATVVDQWTKRIEQYVLPADPALSERPPALPAE